MIALPFIYFGLWFFIEYRKRGLDIYTFIILLYTIISLLSIIIDQFDLYYDSCPKMPTLGLLAPVVYILLLTICIQPFSKFKSNSIEKIIGNISEKRFNYIVIAYFIIFLVVFLVSLTRIQEILTSNALAEIRDEQYQGENTSFYQHLSGIPRYICAICYVLSPSSYIMILFFYVGITHFNKGILYSLMSLCGSFTMLLIAINMVDRSNFAYWALTFIMCYVLFRNRFTTKTKRYFYLFSIILAAVMVAYLAVVTISRFGDIDGGSSHGVITYMGMSYINFCNFFNYLVFNVPHKPEILFLPNINEYVLHGPSYFQFMEYLSNYYHHNLSTFSTFLGFIMSVSGFGVTVVFCVVYWAIATLFIRRPRVEYITLKKLILFWIVVLVPVLGLLCYYYRSATVNMNILIWWIMGCYLTTPLKKRTTAT